MKWLAALLVGAIILVPTRSRADDVVHIPRPFVVEVDGKRYDFAPSYVASEPAWKKLDDSLKAGQEAQRMETSTDIGDWIRPYVIVFGIGFGLGVAGTVLAVSLLAPTR